MASLLPVLKGRFFDTNGDPLSGGKLYTYVANTATPQATYTDSTGDTPNTNPVVLDSNGEADVWLAGGNYKFVLTDADDVVQWTVDNVSSSTAAAEDAAADAEVSATSASNHALTARRWATYTDGTVTDASTGVDSGEYSAKKYAQDAAASAILGGGLWQTSGTRASPNSITAAGGITSSSTAARQVQFVQGSGGAVTVTANPQISNGTNIGQELKLKGRSDTNTLTFANGNGLSLNGDITLGDDDEITLWWDGSLWQEASRRR